MLTRILDLIALGLIKLFIGIINLIPLSRRVSVISWIIRVITSFVPSYKQVSYRNLSLVFPDRDKEFYDDIYRKSFDNLARVLVDFARLHTLDSQWVKDHVECDFLPEFARIKRENPGVGVLIATGHLGSFELMAHSIAVLGYPISFVVRNAKLPKLDLWWISTRQKSGNEVINRSGAVKKVIANLSNGKDAALLFDQNVKKNHAVFVDWFGRPAATTMTIGLSAVRCRSKIAVCSMRYLGNDRYSIDAVECDCSDVYDSEHLSLDEKILEITRRATKEFEQMILKTPEAWFWMHRRWKTAPEGETERFYG